MTRLVVLAAFLFACTAGVAHASWSDWGFSSYDECMGATGGDWADCNDGTQPNPADPPGVSPCPDGYSPDGFGNCVANQPPVQQPPPPNCEVASQGTALTVSPNIVTAFVSLTCSGTPPFAGDLTLKLLRADVSSAGPWVQVASDEVQITNTNPAITIVYPCNLNPFNSWFLTEADWTIGDSTGAGQPGTNRQIEPLPVTPFQNGGCL